MDGVAKDVDADDDAPEVARQQRNVVKRGAGHAQQQGHQAVEEAERKGVAEKVADGGAVPGGLAEGLAVKDGGLDAVDAHAPHAHEGENLVDGPAADEPLLCDVGYAVQGRAEEGEEVALDHVDSGSAVGAGNVVTSQEDAAAANGDDDTDDLEDLVADAEEEEGEDDDDDDGPEVEELGREDVGVAVGQNGEVIAFDIEEGEDEVLPAVAEKELAPLLEAVLVDGDGEVDEEQQDVVEDGLEGWDRDSVVGKEGGEGVGRGDAQGEDLADNEDDPEVDGGEVAPPVHLPSLDVVQALAYEFGLVMAGGDLCCRHRGGVEVLGGVVVGGHGGQRCVGVAGVGVGFCGPGEG